MMGRELRDFGFFVEEAEPHLEALEALVNEMPSHGNVESDCQRMVLMNAVASVRRAINGTTPEDFEVTAHVGNRK